MNLMLEGRTCFVTGASSGIGAGVARLLALQGARASQQSRGRRKAAGIEWRNTRRRRRGTHHNNGRPHARRRYQPGRHEAVHALGQADILINAAGAARPTSPDAGDEIWDEAFLLNFTSTRRLTTALLPGMRRRRWGRVINISGSMSPLAQCRDGGQGALHLWAKGLSCDIAGDGVTVNTIQPGRIDSEQVRTKLHPTEASRVAFIERNIPIGYFGEPADVANLVAFLASPLARYITGAVIPVDAEECISSRIDGRRQSLFPLADAPLTKAKHGFKSEPHQGLRSSPDTLSTRFST